MPTPSVFDEFGSPWRVSGGHPGARFVNKLARNNYRLVVLPFLALATGKLTAPAVEPDDIIRATRLRDCLGVLEGTK